MTRNEDLQKYLQNQKLDWLAADRAISRSLKSGGGGSGGGSNRSGGGGGSDGGSLTTKDWGTYPTCSSSAAKADDGS